MKNISWDNINWSVVNLNVCRLQLRIFRASVQKDWEKVHKLQKLLLSSESAKFLATRKVEQQSLNLSGFSLTKMLFKSETEKMDIAINLVIDGHSVKKSTKKLRLVEVLSTKDKAKQELVLLALIPQWKANFGACNYGFYPGKSSLNIIEALLFRLSKEQKWVFQVDLSDSFGGIDYELLIKKCNTFPKIEKQLRVWLKDNALASSQIRTEGISSFFVSVALYGIETLLDEFASSLLKNDTSNSELLNFAGHGCNFLILSPDKEILEKVKIILESFFESLRLDLQSVKMKIVHTYKREVYPPGFDFLGFNIIHKDRWVRNKKTRLFLERELITLINPSKTEIKIHLREVKRILTSYAGLSQERIIDLLNPVIEHWALSKRQYSSSKLFQKLDACLYKYLWDWAKKRHPLMTEIKIKFNYFHKIENQRSVFAKKTIVNNKEVYKKLSSYSSIKAGKLTGTRTYTDYFICHNTVTS